MPEQGFGRTFPKQSGKKLDDVLSLVIEKILISKGHGENGIIIRHPHKEQRRLAIVAFSLTCGGSPTEHGVLEALRLPGKLLL